MVVEMLHAIVAHMAMDAARRSVNVAGLCTVLMLSVAGRVPEGVEATRAARHGMLTAVLEQVRSSVDTQILDPGWKL